MIYTKNLNLFKWNLVTDLEEQFSITDSLNNNWDKIDSFAQLVNADLSDLKTSMRHFRIGDPIFRLDNKLESNEIRLEGAEVSKTDYAALYNIYGERYGKASKTGCFLLPNFKSRTIWGVSGFTSDGEPVGYMEPGLPNIAGTFQGGANDYRYGTSYVSGAFTCTGTYRHGYDGDGLTGHTKISFKASNSNDIYGSSSTVRPPAVRVRVVTRFK